MKLMVQGGVWNAPSQLARIQTLDLGMLACPSLLLVYPSHESGEAQGLVLAKSCGNKADVGSGSARRGAFPWDCV